MKITLASTALIVQAVISLLSVAYAHPGGSPTAVLIAPVRSGRQGFGISRSFHRDGAITSKSGQPCGLQCRVSRAVMASKEDSVYRAKLAEQAARFDEMASAVKQATETGVELTVEERNLLAVAYKNIVEVRRVSARAISDIQQKVTATERQKQLAREYREKVENELKDICNDILGLLDKYLIPKASNPEAKVFYLKMKGDYNRYLAEFTTGNSCWSVANASEKAYQEGLDMAKSSKIPPTDPIRLGLALNFSVLYRDILNSPEKASQLAKQAFDESINALDTLNEDKYKDSTRLMVLLRENLTLWTSG